MLQLEEVDFISPVGLKNIICSWCIIITSLDGVGWSLIRVLTIPSLPAIFSVLPFIFWSMCQIMHNTIDGVGRGAHV